MPTASVPPVGVQMRPVALRQVQITGEFWAARQAVNRSITIPDVYRKCQETGRIEAFRLAWRPGQPNRPHHFWDSDVAKWIEAAAYSLATHPDADLEEQVDAVIDLIAASQQPDGYLNSYYSQVEPERRWANLRDMHELYCAGHLTEAAVAYFESTGKRVLLDAVCRYVDYIATVFGRQPGQKRGYPGHEELELALVRLYRVTQNPHHLALAQYFVDERGQQPHYFDVEAIARGEDPLSGHFHGNYAYNQSAVPVRELDTADGHAVRAMYLYAAMADLAAEVGDATLLAACDRLWDNVTTRRMYVTGGIGSSAYLERFTFDYDLPNDIAYTETCAAIGLVLWAHRLLQIKADATYADVMERALYNGVISGVSLGGDRFFYANPLDVNPIAHFQRPDLYRAGTMAPEREPWFSCSCCPTNIVRLLAALGQYTLSTAGQAAYIHLYTAGSAHLTLHGTPVILHEDTRYPWDGQIHFTVEPTVETTFTLALRIPGWTRGASLRVNGQLVDLHAMTRRGYAHITRTWRAGDTVELELPMPVERITAHPAVRSAAGRVALQRGPLVYCLEELDNGPYLADVALPADAELTSSFDPGLLGGMVRITGEAQRHRPTDWATKLYTADPVSTVTVPLMAVPYFAWGNRGRGEMTVWLHQA